MNRPKAPIKNDILERFLTALEENNPEMKTVFVLNRRKGLTYAEVATHCRISVGVVEKHMTNALRLFSEVVKEQ